MRHKIAGRAAGASLALVLLISGGCGTSTPVGRAPAGADTGLDRMERLALNANRCWFKSKDPAFSAYTLAPELSSFSGRPRFLLVPRGKVEARPLLVVEGRSGSSDVSSYGPLMGEPVAARVSADLDRWKAGDDSCSA